MKAFSSRRLFTRGATRTILLGHKSETLFRLSQFSTLSTDAPSSPSFHSSSRRNSEDSKKVRVTVWWNIETCPPPRDANCYKVSQFIMAALRANGIKGTIHIQAFEGKNSADMHLLNDLMEWVACCPPPAYIFLISGGRHFAKSLHRIRMKNYNILLACNNDAPAEMRSAASIVWEWTELVKGRNLIGKHFKKLPDGPFDSWYDHYRVPLEDPFVVFDQKRLQSEEVYDSGSRAIVNVIRRISSSDRMRLVGHVRRMLMNLQSFVASLTKF